MTSTTEFSQTRWSLEELFPSQDSPEMQAALAELDAQVGRFEQRRDDLRPDIDPEVFMELIEQLEGVTRVGTRVMGFSRLWLYENTQDQAALAYAGRMDHLMASLSNRTMFFSLWWKDVDDATAERLMSVAGDYRYWLEEMRNFKPHTLSEAEEKIINIKSTTGSRALNTLYDSITTRYVFKLELDGEMRELTQGEISALYRHHDPAVRQRAYQEVYRVYQQDAPILGQIYQNLVRDWFNEQVELRSFPSPIAARNLANDIPDDVVDTLLEVCQRNAPVFQRFFKLKAKLLGLERLRRYDIYAPIGQAERSYDFSTAYNLVLESFGAFDPQVAEMARRVFVADHLDSEVRKGKANGAFCMSLLPELTPWVLQNYQGRPNDVATMAHELGHAVHSMLAAHHNLFTFRSSLPLAETASTFGEMMLVDRMLAEESDEGVRRDLLFKQVDDAYATVLRQAFFALFERRAHDLIQQGASIDELAAAYWENVQMQFGDSIELNEEFKWEWVLIPHIYHVPFYVYAYTFGQLLVLALYQQYKAEGESFKPRYLEILAAGGSAAPVEILARAGIDIHSQAFWQGGFDVIAGLVEQLEAMTGS
jgi:oligoendopeptidase F